MGIGDSGGCMGLRFLRLSYSEQNNDEDDHCPDTINREEKSRWQ